MNGSKARELRQASRRYIDSVGGGFADGPEAAKHVDRFTKLTYKRMKQMFKAAKKGGAI